MEDIMTYLQGYALSIKTGGEFLREKNTGNERQVYLPFNKEYGIQLKNKTNKRAKFQVRIDGKLTAPEICWFIASPGEKFLLERFMLDGNMDKGEKFKFVAAEGSGEEPGESDNGLIEITILPEKDYPFKTSRSFLRSKSSDHQQQQQRRIVPFSEDPHKMYGTSIDINSSGNLFDDNPKLLNPSSAELESLAQDFMESLQDVQEGVTVGGSKSNQSFREAAAFKTEGKVVLSIRMKSTQPVKSEFAEDCPACDGRKWQQDFKGIKQRCPMCQGKGRIQL